MPPDELAHGAPEHRPDEPEHDDRVPSARVAHRRLHSVLRSAPGRLGGLADETLRLVDGVLQPATGRAIEHLH